MVISPPSPFPQPFTQPSPRSIRAQAKQLTPKRPDEPVPESPYTTAILLLSTIHHASATFYAYTRYCASPQTAFVVGAFGSGALATSGLFTLLFAGDSTRKSKKDGFDKDTSSYPFGNKESYRSKKKEAKEN